MYKNSNNYIFISGQKFAMLEMKAAVSKVVNNYKLLPGSDKNLDLTLTLILKSISGIKVKIVPRK